jgi:hypothetical protein
MKVLDDGWPLTRQTWIVLSLWFLFALFGSVGWIGPGPAFLIWSLPAVVTFFLAWRRLLLRARPPRAWPFVLLLWGWTVLATAALDGGDRLVPESLFVPLWIALLLFPPLLGVLVVSLARQGETHSSEQPG